MKRIALLFALVLLACSILSGCAKKLTDEEMLDLIDEDNILARAEEILEQRSEEESPEATPSPTPAVDHLAPIDLLNEGYNPFYGLVLSEGYKVFGAIFDSGDPQKTGQPNYVLRLTAEGKAATIVKEMSVLAGYEDTESLLGFVGEMEENGFATIDGTPNGKNIYIQLKKTVAGGDFAECQDVDGCRVELTFNLSEADVALYWQFILDNYNTAMLGDLAAGLADKLDPSQFCVYVNTQAPAYTSVFVAYHVPDAAGVENKIATDLSPDWHDEGQHKLALTYGRIFSEFQFDLQSNYIFVEQFLNDSIAASFDYTKA